MRKENKKNTMEANRNALVKMLKEAKRDLDEKQIVVWGVGNTAKLYKENINKLQNEGLNITYYTDNNSKKWGEQYNGKTIIDPQKIKGLSGAFVIICSMNPGATAQIRLQLTELGVEGESIDKVIFSQHYREVMEVYDMLEDMESKRVYAGLIKARMEVVNPAVDVVAADQYYILPQFNMEDEREVFVECGAYTGDTLEAYIRKKRGKFGQIIGFEPDPDNMRKAGKRVEKLLEEFKLDKSKIVIYPFAVGDREEHVFISRSETNKGNLSQIIRNQNDTICLQEGTEAITQVALDSFLTMPYAFLKADVEGYEYKVLLGAEKGIKRYKPLLAVCIYHSAMDFYEIPICIKRMVPEYKLAVRHHKETLSETVIYAYVN